MRNVSLVSSLAVLAVLAGVAAPTAAESYNVTMKSGSVFETRYRPRQASWDAAKVVLLTEIGNSIALRKEDIASVTANSENRGFGRVIDNTTLELGFAANDAPDPATPADPARALAEALMQQQPQAPNYDQKQFVEPSQAGGGLPVSWTQPAGGMLPQGGQVFLTSPSGTSTPPPQ